MDATNLQYSATAELAAGFLRCGIAGVSGCCDGIVAERMHQPLPKYATAKATRELPMLSIAKWGVQAATTTSPSRLLRPNCCPKCCVRRGLCCHAFPDALQLVADFLHERLPDVLRFRAKLFFPQLFE